MRNAIKLKIRKILWKLLGVKYEEYLFNQRRITFLDDFKEAEIGDKSYNNGAKVWKWNSSSSLTIGKYCSIANDVNFILDSGNHDMFKITTYPLYDTFFNKNEKIRFNGEDFIYKDFKFNYKPKKDSIKIKNEVWIGAGVTILPGVTIGNGAVVLAGAVVSKSVDDYSVVAGVPAVHVKYRFSETIRKKMLLIAWWDWDEAKIRENVDDFNIEIEEFVKKYT
ncbi:CatB-related O-acetyltransferase [Flavobacterium agricola]|uniref:CatB-related O-acetyltransferase n=1 Tax=Flavobacterium agricola TaxID=2870839 RepID=A0ABY6LW89_9FLAO|nr:CatB-related O-acetyltransferase [Flavobacterium agricola]UYW00506.1 CatB-related O-acetyltransferase [Flavobacterium agricola]